LIQLISAVTFAVRHMARSVEFYKKLGFELLYGGESAAFSNLKAKATGWDCAGGNPQPRGGGRYRHTTSVG